MSTFGSVTKSPSVLRVTVHRSHPLQGEFSALMYEFETMYTQYSQPFVLAMDLHLMGTLHPVDALQWMMMFFRVSETTKKHLICTCICASSTLDDAIQSFLHMYDPIKPFYSLKRATRSKLKSSKGPHDRRPALDGKKNQNANNYQIH
jgi:hypothetical protein